MIKICIFPFKKPKGNISIGKTVVITISTFSDSLVTPSSKISLSKTGTSVNFWYSSSLKLSEFKLYKFIVDVTAELISW